MNVPFWADGATKRRWVAVPRGERIRYSRTGEWGFPAGTVFVKHFEFDGRRVETRVLVRGANGGVHGASYRWRPDQADAEVVTAGYRGPVPGMPDRSWYFPGPDDCRKCHLAAAGGVLGVSTRQLNRTRADAAENQLLAWSRLGLLDTAVRPDDLPHLPRLTSLDDASAPAEARARSYLDANCAYCHRPGGAAADFDARVETPLAKQALVGAPARINLGLDRARQIAPNDPWRSMVLVRLESLDETRMPPLGHGTIDRRGAAALRAWIGTLPGLPVVGPPTVEPKGGDFRDPVRVTVAHPDPAAVIRYTLDGSPPGPNSPVYDRPLRLTGSATVRARAFKPGHTPSVVAQDTYVIGD